MAFPFIHLDTYMESFSKKQVIDYAKKILKYYTYMYIFIYIQTMSRIVLFYTLPYYVSIFGLIFIQSS